MKKKSQQKKKQKVDKKSLKVDKELYESLLKRMLSKKQIQKSEKPT